MTGREQRIIGHVAAVVGVSPRDLVGHAQGGRQAVYGRRLAAYVLSLDGTADYRIADLLGWDMDTVRAGRRMVAAKLGEQWPVRADLGRLARAFLRPREAVA